MGTLVCTGIVSVDGYVNDASGAFDWAAPDVEVHAFVNDLERPVTTCVYGRRLYETMTYWEDPPDLEDEPDVVRDYAALWQAADKVVVSSTLPEVLTARTTLVRSLDPAFLGDLVRRSEGPVSLGGPTLAASAFAWGLVDEVQLITVPYLAGGGTRFLPDGFHSRLRLLDQRSFANGTVFTRYSLR